MSKRDERYHYDQNKGTTMENNTTPMLTIDGFDRATKEPAFIAIKSVEDGSNNLFLTFDSWDAATSTLAVLMGWPLERLMCEQRVSAWVQRKDDAVMPYSPTQDIHIGIMGGG